MLVYAVIDTHTAPGHPLGDAVETFLRREDAERESPPTRGRAHFRAPRPCADASAPSVEVQPNARKKLQRFPETERHWGVTLSRRQRRLYRGRACSLFRIASA